MAQFPATRHSVLAAIRSDDGNVRRVAFDALVTAYWKPVFKYVRLKWSAPPDDAADLTQAFFLRAYEKEFFEGFDPARARFRTYLRTCLDGFVANARKAESRLKRGGGVTLVPIDFEEAERELSQRAHNAIDDFDAYDLAGDEAARPTYAELARRFGLSATDVTNELAAARREFRRLVLDALREQCAGDEEFEAESRALTGRSG